MARMYAASGLPFAMQAIASCRQSPALDLTSGVACFDARVIAFSAACWYVVFMLFAFQLTLTMLQLIVAIYGI